MHSRSLPITAALSNTTPTYTPDPDKKTRPKARYGQGPAFVKTTGPRTVCPGISHCTDTRTTNNCNWLHHHRYSRHYDQREYNPLDMPGSPSRRIQLERYVNHAFSKQCEQFPGLLNAPSQRLHVGCCPRSHADGILICRLQSTGSRRFLHCVSRQQRLPCQGEASLRMHHERDVNDAALRATSFHPPNAPKRSG